MSALDIKPNEQLLPFLKHLEKKKVKYEVIGEDDERATVIGVIFEYESNLFPGKWYSSVRMFHKDMSEDVLARVLSDGNFPSKYTVPILNDEVYQTQAIRYMEAYKKLLPKTILLLGPTDVGKTYAAVWLAAELLKEREINRPSFVRSNEVHKTRVGGKWDFPFRDAEFMVLDDLGVEIKTSKVTYLHDDVGALIYELVNYRMENELPTVITSNIGDEKEFDIRYTTRFLKRLRKFGMIQTVEGKEFDGQENIPF